jgi:hypothetical protein
VRAIGPLIALVVLSAACTASSSPSPSDIGPEQSAAPAPTPTPEPTPYPTTVGDMPALVIPLGGDSAPIDVIDAFGSIWVANHHTDDVSRLDPQTGEEVARISLGAGSGPGWFAVTDDSIWVTRQNARGMSQIDPATNTVVRYSVGDFQTCWRPAAALGAVWYWGCDDDLMVRVDPATYAVSTITADGYSQPLVVDGALYATGPDGLALLDPATSSFVLVGGCCGPPVGFGEGTIWLSAQAVITRVDLANGSEVGELAFGAVNSVTFAAGSAWTTIEGDTNLLEVDPATNQIVRELPIGPMPIKVHFAFDALWVTDFVSSEVWRISLGG